MNFENRAQGYIDLIENSEKGITLEDFKKLLASALKSMYVEACKNTVHFMLSKRREGRERKRRREMDVYNEWFLAYQEACEKRTYQLRQFRYNQNQKKKHRNG